MVKYYRRLLAWLGTHSYIVLLTGLLVILGTWGFIELADEVLEGETQTFDEWVIRPLRQPHDLAIPIGPEWLHEVGRDITALGGIAVLTLVVLAVAGYLLMIRKFYAMWLVLIATVGALILSTALKYAFARPRPELVPHLSQVITPSFPSGHAMLSAAVYLTLGSLLTRLVPDRIVKIYFLAIAVILTIFIGLSRIYMGVHYPTDVLAGWSGGFSWALVCWLVARYLQSRGTVERDVDQPAE